MYHGDGISVSYLCISVYLSYICQCVYVCLFLMLAAHFVYICATLLDSAFANCMLFLIWDWIKQLCNVSYLWWNAFGNYFCKLCASNSSVDDIISWSRCKQNVCCISKLDKTDASNSGAYNATTRDKTFLHWRQLQSCIRIEHHNFAVTEIDMLWYQLLCA